jgi:sensor histidine kinase YesM
MADDMIYWYRVIRITGKSYHQPFSSFFLIISLFASLIFFRVIRITSKSYHQPFNSFFLIISLLASLILFRVAGIRLMIKKKLLNG